MFRSLERGKLLYEDALFYLFIKELMVSDNSSFRSIPRSAMLSRISSLWRRK